MLRGRGGHQGRDAELLDGLGDLAHLGGAPDAVGGHALEVVRPGFGPIPPRAARRQGGARGGLVAAGRRMPWVVMRSRLSAPALAQSIPGKLCCREAITSASTPARRAARKHSRVSASRPLTITLRHILTADAWPTVL